MMEVALGNPPDFDVVQSIQDNLRTLSQATAPSPNGTSAVPLDLLVTAEYLTSVVSYYNLVLEEGLTDLTASVIVSLQRCSASSIHSILNADCPTQLWSSSDGCVMLLSGIYRYTQYSTLTSSY